MLLVIGGLVLGAILQPTAPEFLPRTGSIHLIKRAASWASPCASIAALGLALVVAGLLRLAGLPRSFAYAAALPPLIAAVLFTFGPSLSGRTGIHGVYWLLGLLWPSAIVLYALAWTRFSAWGLPCTPEADGLAGTVQRDDRRRLQGGPK